MHAGLLMLSVSLLLSACAGPDSVREPAAATPEPAWAPVVAESDASKDVLIVVEAEDAKVEERASLPARIVDVGWRPDPVIPSAVRFGSGDLRLLLLGVIHGNEDELDPSFLDAWLREAPLGASDIAEIAYVPVVNPSGARHGSRYNSRGVDVNRNFPASNFRPSVRNGRAPLSEPESRAIARLIESFDPDVIVAFHSTRSGPFVNFDGPAETEAIAFAEAAQRTDARWRVVPNYTNPPGSLGSWAGLDIGIPVLTIEFDRGQDHESAAAAAVAGIIALIRE
ncbi:MAG: DUF2817 domain-containing protein [Planctomycetota bacterium]